MLSVCLGARLKQWEAGCTLIRRVAMLFDAE